MQVVATKLPHESLSFMGADVLDLDILDAEETRRLLQEVSPDYIFHLAAQSSTGLSWEKPELTIEINVIGALHVMDALRQLPKSTRMLLIGSGEEYGLVRTCEVPIKEETILRPGNVYAISKATQTMLGALYANAYGLHIVCARSFNHIGPGQSCHFVVPDFCRQIADIERSLQPPIISVGNLEAVRDFTDVRDVVRAYLLLIEKGRAGEIYNVGSGNAVSIQHLLDLMLSFSPCSIKVERNEIKYRPVDVPVISADISKLQKDTGWSPEITLEESLRDALEAFR